MDNYVDNFVENLVNKSVNNPDDNTVDKLVIDENIPVWIKYWANFMSQSPFYQGEYSQEFLLLIMALCQSLENGDSCLSISQPLDKFSSMVNDYTTLLAQDSSTDLAHYAKYKPLVLDENKLYLQRYWQLEYQLAQSIRHLIASPVQKIDLSPYQSLLTDQYQQYALDVGINQNFAIITGGPGTGKTYLLARIVAVLKQHTPDLRIALAAPTGKAAQRMQEALQTAFSDEKLQAFGLANDELKQLQTKTLHRLLGIGTRQVAKYHQDFPLPYDVVVVDEASMLDLNLAYLLFDAIKPPTRLILLGDAQQLTSVDVGYVLADLQHSQSLTLHHAKLVNSQRFSSTANIGKFAQFIYADNQQPTVEQWLEEVQPQHISSASDIPQRLDEHQVDWVGYYALGQYKDLTLEKKQQIYQCLVYGYHDYVAAIILYRDGKISIEQLCQAFDRYRILVSIKAGEFGLQRLNQVVIKYLKHQLHESPAAEWFEGLAVMMVYNDYALGLSNGDIGICVKNKQTQQYEVYFATLQKCIAVARLPQSIQTAFALTIHKSQGSEFQHVAIVLDQQAERLLGRELIYTAVTRAKKMVSIYADEMTLNRCFQQQTQRNSGLATKIDRAD